MKREEFLKEYVQTHIDYPKIVKEILVINDKVFVIKNEDLIYNYTKFSSFISELRMAMCLFGYVELYLCENFSSPRQTINFQLD